MTADGEVTTRVRSSLPRTASAEQDHLNDGDPEHHSLQRSLSHHGAESDTARTAWPEIRFYIGSASLFFVVFALVTGVWVLGPMVVLGWHSAAITSGSMEPAIQVGDVVVFAEAAVRRRDESRAGAEIGPGTVVVFPDSRGSLDDGRYVTRGDNNPVNDSTLVPRKAVRGVGRVLVPYAGYPAVWVSGGPLLSVVLLAAMFGGLSFTSRWALLPSFSPWQDKE